MVQLMKYRYNFTCLHPYGKLCDVESKLNFELLDVTDMGVWNELC
jgi:hypothetical protein